MRPFIFVLIAVLLCGCPSKPAKPPSSAPAPSASAPTWQSSPNAVVISDRISLQPTGAAKLRWQKGKSRVTQQNFRLPDGQLLTILRFEVVDAQNRILLVKKLAEQKHQLDGSRIVIAIGNLSLSQAENDRESFLERFITPAWLVAHSLSKARIWPQVQIFLDKELYDGTRGWKVIPASARIQNDVFSIDLQ